MAGYWGDTRYDIDGSVGTLCEFTITTKSTVSITGSQQSTSNLSDFIYTLVSTKGTTFGDDAVFRGNNSSIQKSWYNVPPGTYRIRGQAKIFDDYGIMITRGNAYTTSSN